MDKNILIGKRIKEARELRQLSLESVGDKMGVHKSTVSRWERGGVDNISLATISKLADVLDINEDWLSGKDVPMIARQPAVDVFSIPGILPLPQLIPKPRLGTIACGTPIMSEENFDGFDLAPDTIDCDFTLIAQGDSMIGARIHDGDIVYVKHQEVVDNGQIAVVMIDDEKTLKRFYKNGDKVTLLPENPAYEPMVYVGRELENIRILGRAVAFSSYIR